MFYILYLCFEYQCVDYVQKLSNISSLSGKVQSIGQYVGQYVLEFWSSDTDILINISQYKGHITNIDTITYTAVENPVVTEIISTASSIKRLLSCCIPTGFLNCC